MSDKQITGINNEDTQVSPSLRLEGRPYITGDISMRPDMHRNKEEIKKHSEKFETLVGKSARVLFRAKTIFPFKFFPEHIIIDENKVSIVRRLFFFSNEIQCILIHHIKDVMVDTDLFFGSLKILPDGYGEEWVGVGFLPKEDAIRARRIIAGLLVGFKEGVDMTKVETTNMEQKIEALGSVG